MTGAIQARLDALGQEGAKEGIDVRDTSIRMLNKASDTAIRRVRTPAMRTE